jgi:LuxR family transcriptional regulator, maltose regulon positive regulatory protein
LFSEAEALLDGCPEAGALPARLAAARRAASAGEPLTEREREILRFLGGGLTEREIGGELYLSFNTVHSHVKSLYRKLGVSSRSEAVARARDLT